MATKKQNIKLVSWNVNGIRAIIKKGFNTFLEKYEPDIICLQEIKINNKARTKENFDFAKYAEFWNSAKKPGYAGTAVFIKESWLKNNPVLSIKDKINKKEFDNEGRVQTLEFKKFFLINAYFPHSRHDLSRLKFKLDFNKKILEYVKKLEKIKPIILTGDLNVAHEEIDLANPKTNNENPGFRPEERADMTKLLNSGIVDTFRYLHPKKIQYSWWSYKFNARARNIGWRIDYFCVNKKLIKQVKSAMILDKQTGSDHCPITLNIYL